MLRLRHQLLGMPAVPGGDARRGLVTGLDAQAPHRLAQVIVDGVVRDAELLGDDLGRADMHEADTGKLGVGQDVRRSQTAHAVMTCLTHPESTPARRSTCLPLRIPCRKGMALPAVL